MTFEKYDAKYHDDSMTYDGVEYGQVVRSERSTALQALIFRSIVWRDTSDRS